MKTNREGLTGARKKREHPFFDVTPPGLVYTNQIIIPIIDGTAPRFKSTERDVGTYFKHRRCYINNREMSIHILNTGGVTSIIDREINV